MAATQPFRFAVQSFSASSAHEWRERARRVEDLGYSALHLADHVLGPGEAIAAANHPIQELAAVPAMAMAAEATSTLRIGCRVFCIDYRHPAVLAKEVATLDLLSDGRLEIGLGAGWLRAEYDALGIPFDEPAVRIERLGEVIETLRAHMGDGPVKISGRHVRLSGFEGAPKPVQKPNPPLMIGGGSRRVLELAAREADIVSFNFNNRSGTLGPEGVKSGTSSATARKLDWVREAAGARFAELELEIGAYFTMVTDKGSATSEAMAGAFGLSPEEMAAHPHALIGSVESICEVLERRREELGISYVTVPDTTADVFAGVVARLSGR
jgi:probable F420-dependent oxidoreductase